MTNYGNKKIVTKDELLDLTKVLENKRKYWEQKFKKSEEEFSNKLEQLKKDISDEISYANRMNLTEINLISRINHKIEELRK